MSQQNREQILTDGLTLNKPGLEVSPLYRPTVRKQLHNVFYTDYTSAEESRKKHSNYEHDEIMEIDFVWTPGKRLIDCVKDSIRFDWAVSSHVLEHVPNPIGWLLEVFEVLNPGAAFSLALPDKRYCFDRFRRETDAADLIDVWARGQSIPSPYQIFDFLSRSVDGSGEAGKRAFETAARFEDAARHYTDDQALEFVINSWTAGSYFDVHCSAFTPESFVKVIEQLNRLGILNVEISAPVTGQDEFFVKLIKIGEPRLPHPGQGHQLALGNISSLIADLNHARKAFDDAVLVQNQLKMEIQSALNYSMKLKSWIPNWFGRFLVSRS